jgi:hypothetical protein
MELTKEYLNELKVAGLSIADLPKTHSELHKMIWAVFECGRQNKSLKSAPAVVGLQLTPRQALWLINNIPKQPPNSVITTKWRNNKLAILKKLQAIVDEGYE